MRCPLTTSWVKAAALLPLALLLAALACTQAAALPADATATVRFSSLGNFKKALLKCSEVPKTLAGKIPDSSENPELPADCEFLDSTVHVTLKDGGSIKIGTNYLADKYRRTADTKGAKTRIEEFREFRIMIRHLGNSAQELAEPPESRDFGDFEADLQKVLDRDEFQEKKSWLEKIIPRSFIEWLENLLGRERRERRNRDGGNGVDWSTVFKVVVITMGVFLAVYMVAVLSQSFGKMRDDYEDNKIGGDNDVIKTNPEDMVARADVLAKSGDFRSALRFLYKSFLRATENAGHISYLETKTNREYLDELARSIQVSPELRDMTRMYENYWYGVNECTPGEYRKFCNLYRDCIREL